MRQVAHTEWHRQGLLNRFDWINDDIRLILLSGSYSWSTTESGTYQSISSHEVQGPGYQQGGAPLPARSTATSDNEARFRSGAVLWDLFQGEARYAAIVNFSASTPYVIGLVDFTEPAHGQISPIIVRWNGGVVLVARAIVKEEQA